MPLIVDYRLGWHPGQDRGFVEVRVLGGSGAITLPVSSAEEFVAVATVLQEGPVSLNPDGSITTGAEPVSDNQN